MVCIEIKFYVYKYKKPFNNINKSTENNQLSQTQKLKQWLELQFDEITNNNSYNNSKNKEEFAYIFWKKISDNKTKNDNIIRNLVSIISITTKSLQILMVLNHMN